MDNFRLLMPPVAFAIVFLATLGFAWLLSRLAFQKRQVKDGGGEPYACGERNTNPMIQPDYGQFLPFALFFTILHVVTLTIATAPALGAASFVMAIIYVAGAIVALTVLYAK